MSGAADASGGEEALALGAAGGTGGLFFFFRQREGDGAASRRYFKPNLSHKEMDWTLLDRSRLAFSSWCRRASASVPESAVPAPAEAAQAVSPAARAFCASSIAARSASSSATSAVKVGATRLVGAWQTAATGFRGAIPAVAAGSASRSSHSSSVGVRAPK